MRRDAAQSMQGIVGCLDPDERRLRGLGEWAHRHGATILCDDGHFRLWSWMSAPAKAHPIRRAGLCGMLSGELYLPSDVPDGNPSAHTSGDIVAAGYCRTGATDLSQLRGQFGVFLWDRGRQEVMLFRDASGTRSIYYSELAGGGVVFSDHLDLMVTNPLVEKRLCRRSLHEYLRFLDVSAPNTIYDKVFATEAGVLLRIGCRGLQQEESRRPGGNPSPVSPGAAADELERRLADAVSARLCPNATTIAFLSGGVDSSLVCSLAAGIEGGRIEALTVGFQEDEYDESHLARRVAKYLGVPHHAISFPIGTYLKAFEELTAGIQYPSADPAGVPTLLACQAARNHGEAALDGTGADTLFGVMPARHQRIAVQFGTLLPRRLRRLAARGIKALPGLSGYAPIVDFDDPEEILIRWRGWNRCEIERLCGEPISLAHTRFYRLFRQFPRDAHLQRYSALLGNLPDDRIHQAAALTGLEVRLPYLDAIVSDWVNGLDPGLLYHPSEPKPMLKAVLERHIPRALWDFPKHGFDFPFLGLLTAEDFALVRTYLDPGLTGRWALFDSKELAATATAFIRGEQNSVFAPGSQAFRVWALVVLFAWLTNHFSYL